MGDGRVKGGLGFLHRAHSYLRENTMVNRLAIAGLMLVLSGSMSACAMGGASWKEEVLLHDGGRLIVERSVARKGRHELGQQPPIGEQSLTFALPGTKESVTWEDRYSEDLGSANFTPMLLEIAKGTPYVVAAPMGCLSYNKWGRPNPPYVVFQYQGNAWNRVPLDALPPEISQPNLVISSPDDAAARNAKLGVLSAETIKRLNRGSPGGGDPALEYKAILRAPAKGWVDGSLVNCPDFNSRQYRSPKAPLPMRPLTERE